MIPNQITKLNLISVIFRSFLWSILKNISFLWIFYQKIVFSFKTYYVDRVKFWCSSSEFVVSCINILKNSYHAFKFQGMRVAELSCVRHCVVILGNCFFNRSCTLHDWNYFVIVSWWSESFKLDNILDEYMSLIKRIIVLSCNWFLSYRI